MKHKLLLATLVFSFNTVYAQPATQPMTNTPTTTPPPFSICSNADKVFAMKPGSTVQLEQAKVFIQSISAFAEISPRQTAEDFLKSSSPNSMIFNCTDISTTGELSAQISFTYTVDKNEIRTSPLTVKLVPPDQPKPQPLAIPTPPEAAPGATQLPTNQVNPTGMTNEQQPITNQPQ